MSMPSLAKPLCLVPARAGSKRFPRKNLALLGGKPLLAWTIESALKAAIFDDIWVSSEDGEILCEAKKWGGRPIARPRELAGDHVTVVQVCLHVVQALSCLGRDEYFALYVLLPTSPFRSPETIRRAWQTFLETGADALLSVVATDYPPQWALTQTDGWLHPLHPLEYTLPRQALTPTYRHDGGHVIVRLSTFLEQRSLFGPRTLGFSVPLKEAVDIDEPIHLAWAEFLLERGL